MRFPFLAPVLGGLLTGALVSGVQAVSVEGTIRSPGEYVSPEQVEGATTIQAERAHALWQKDIPFVDPRTPTDFQVGHIPGAVRLQNDPDRSWIEDRSNPGGELEELTEAALKEVVPKDQPVVFYCNGTDCGRSSSSASLAVKWGWQEVYYYRRGFPSWQDAGYPVETSDKWPEQTRGVSYYLQNPEKARWVNNMCDHISFTAWTPRQEKHCKEAKFGLLEYLKERSQQRNQG